MQPCSQGKPLEEVGKRPETKTPQIFVNGAGGGGVGGVQSALWTTSGDSD